jgi:hypothetical protein
MAHHGRPTIYSEAHSRRAETTGQGEASEVGTVTIVTDPPGVISGDDPSSNSRQHFFHLGTVAQTQQDAKCGFPRGELEFSAPSTVFLFLGYRHSRIGLMRPLFYYLEQKSEPKKIHTSDPRPGPRNERAKGRNNARRTSLLAVRVCFAGFISCRLQPSRYFRQLRPSCSSCL